MDFRVSTHHEDGELAVVEVTGDADLYTAPQIRAVLLNELEGGYRWLAVDLGQVEYLDSTALGVLIGALKRARDADGGLCLLNPPPRVQRVLEVTRLVKVFPIYQSASEALAGFRGAQP